VQATDTDQYESCGRLVTSHSFVTEVDGVELQVTAYVSEAIADEAPKAGA
jgi:hypothetical protein